MLLVHVHSKVVRVSTSLLSLRGRRQVTRRIQQQQIPSPAIIVLVLLVFLSNHTAICNPIFMVNSFILHSVNVNNIQHLLSIENKSNSKQQALIRRQRFNTFGQNIVKRGSLGPFYQLQSVPYQVNDVNDMVDENDRKYQHDTPVKVLVIGGGWAGYSVADALSLYCMDDKVQVTVVDASKSVGGLAAGWKEKTKNVYNLNNENDNSNSSDNLNYASIDKQQSTQIQQRSVEVGVHGFWREYRNVFDIIENSIGLELDTVLTPYIPSVLYSKLGRVALAPVFGDNIKDSNYHSTVGVVVPDANKIVQSFLNILRSVLWNSLTQLSNKRNGHIPIDEAIQTELQNSGIADILPSPLNVALLSNFTSSSLTLLDRISAISLLGIWVDFDPNDRKSWSKYDTISAETIFRTSQITNAVYDELVVPLLHVLPMTTPYDCSAAAAISCFHVFALQSQGAFDVRWCRGTISDTIFIPWTTKLLSRGNTVQFRSNTKVSNIERHHDRSSTKSNDFQLLPTFAVTLEQTISTTTPINNESNVTTRTEYYDAVVLAVGITAAKRLAQSCTALIDCPETKNWYKLKAVTCVAVRIYFNGSIPLDIAKAMQDSPVAVVGPKIGNIPVLVETGFCIYDLQRLQDEYNTTNSSSSGGITALEVDFFRADLFVNWSDDEILQLTYRAIAETFHLATAQIDVTNIIDTSIVRARNAVSHFTINSATDIGVDGVKLNKNGHIGLYSAGDWIDRTGHSSWSTEKSVVTGRQVAAAILDDFNLNKLKNTTNTTTTTSVNVIQPPSDSTQLASLRQVAKILSQQR